MPQAEIFLESERLILRKLTLDDAMFILELLNEPSFISNIGDRRIRTLQDASNYLLNGPLKSYETNGFAMYRVERKDDGVILGMTGLVKREGLEHIDIGFAFFPSFWSKGYALESAKVVAEFAKNTLKVKKLLGITADHNTPSIRVLERLGMKFDSFVTLPREGEPVKCFALSFEPDLS